MSEEEDFTLTGIKMDGKSLLLASGSWGEVRKVEHDGVQRAAKKLLTKPTDVTKFLKDCVLYSKLVHKNVLPVLGLCKCEQSNIPAMVMELMECNLAAKLQQHQNIPIHLKLSMLQDVSEGLHYLHTYIPPIVHGNLHSKNIFLTSSLVAKIGDFLPLSVPQEACSPFLPQNTSCEHHAPSLDIFAFGCVVCHVITQQLPMPSGITSNEVELRQHYIDQIELESLKQLVIISLDNKLENRPSISLVCKRITNIRSGRITSIRDQWTSTETVSNKLSSQTNFIKVVIMGAPCAGKTSLAESLLGFPITKKPKMTLEIDVLMNIINWDNYSTATRNESMITSHNIKFPFPCVAQLKDMLKQANIYSDPLRVIVLDCGEGHPITTIISFRDLAVTVIVDGSMKVLDFCHNRNIIFLLCSSDLSLSATGSVVTVIYDASIPVCSIDFSLSATGAPPPLDLDIDHVTIPTIVTVSDQHMSTGPTQKLEIFLDYYAKLSVLPFKDMASHFVAARIISTDENQVIQHTIEKSKNACLVLNKIKDSLEIGNEEKFDKFLAITESYDDDDCAVRLAEEMKQKLLLEAREHDGTHPPKSKRLRTT